MHEGRMSMHTYKEHMTTAGGSRYQGDEYVYDDARYAFIKTGDDGTQISPKEYIDKLAALLTRIPTI